ncbi:MAG TPA: hypothetical protein VMN78_10425 [Longimicrobiales bacterium]|nr:hypothetical protein [Longimicrobiales bacterium]
MTIRRTLGALALAVGVAGLTGCDDITGSDDATIIVQNNATASVEFLFIADCQSGSWGDDRLGSNETIAPGNDREFRVESGCWDLRAEFLDDSFADEFGVGLDDGDEFIWELID